jgi:hypothetical protein
MVAEVVAVQKQNLEYDTVAMVMVAEVVAIQKQKLKIKY